MVWHDRRRFLLPVEDAGLLEGVLALGDVPHPDRPVAAAGGQQAFLTAPTTGDDLTDTETDVSAGRTAAGPTSSRSCLHSLCPGEPPV